MSTAQKILLFAAGLLITVGLIFIAFDVYHHTERIADVISNNAANQAQQMQEEHITKYQNSFLSGAMVISYVKEIYSDVETINIAPIDKAIYNAKSIPEEELYRNMKTLSNNCYVNPLKNFYVTIERNANGVITKVTITEQTE